MKLKRCPFCGGVPILEYCTGDELDIRCDTCGITFEEGFRNREDAIEAWNRRDERTAKVEKVIRVSSVIRTGRCGNCGYDVIDSYKHCPECGAKLDWGE